MFIILDIICNACSHEFSKVIIKIQILAFGKQKWQNNTH
jgi:hypothetical protein